MKYSNKMNLINIIFVKNVWWYINVKNKEIIRGNIVVGNISVQDSDNEI